MLVQRSILTLLGILSILASSACSIKKMAISMVSDALSSSSGNVFTGDEDPELVGDALPFALKLYESLLSQAPTDPKLLLAAGSAFAMYANAYVQGPAELLPEEEYERKEMLLARAKRLYLRGRGYLFRALEIRRRGIINALDRGPPAQALKDLKREDVPLLFWTGAAWMGAYATDTFDMELMVSIPKAFSIMARALELDEAFGQGMIHEFFISYYGSMPVSLGGSVEKARHHFQRALELSQGRKASPYVALASSIAVKAQDYREFKDLLEKALALDPHADADNRLANILAQRKARWLLAHADRFFLEVPEQKQR